MKNFTKIAVVALTAAMSLGANAANIYPAGDATPWGWSLDNASALVSAADNDAVFTGTLYLKAGQDFKFLATTDFGNDEYGSAPGAALTDGKVKLAMGKNDEGYGKLQVAEDANYCITVNTVTLEATIVKSDFQTSQVTCSSLFMVGSATPNGWDVMQGTPLYQSQTDPLQFSNVLDMAVGSFKIAYELKGACSWDAKYWYFRDATDDNKVALGQDGDLQWNIEKAAKYTIKVNLAANSISIKEGEDAVENIAVENDNAPVLYYTISGARVSEPAPGLYIRRQGNRIEKVIIR